MCNAHPYFSLKNWGKKYASYTAKYSRLLSLAWVGILQSVEGISLIITIISIFSAISVTLCALVVNMYGTLSLFTE